MRSLLQHNPSLYDECKLHFCKVFMFWLEAQRRLFDQTCRAKQTHCTSPPSKTNFPTFHLIHGSVKTVSSGTFFFFFHIFPRQCSNFPSIPLFLWFLTFLVWVEVTGILIPRSPSFLLFEQLFTISTLSHTCSKGSDGTSYSLTSSARYPTQPPHYSFNI